jgi:hypothetical protein
MQAAPKDCIGLLQAKVFGKISAIARLLLADNRFSMPSLIIWEPLAQTQVNAARVQFDNAPTQAFAELGCVNELIDTKHPKVEAH